MTFRVWADAGKVPVIWVGRERRFAAGVEAMKVTPGSEPIRLEGRYVRVSGAAGQESLLAAPEAELCVLGRRAKVRGCSGTERRG